MKRTIIYKLLWIFLAVVVGVAFFWMVPRSVKYALTGGHPLWQSSQPTKPVFPPLPAAMGNSKIDYFKVTITGTGPGLPMDLDIYLPKGRNQPKSYLACSLLLPGAGAMAIA